MATGTEHVALIVQFEGFDPNPYWDHHQWSIGYGSFAGGRNRSQRPNIGPITQAQGRAMLAEQLGRYERNVDSFDRIYNWTPNERAAMISFAYNIGSIDGLTENGTRSKAEIARMMLQYNKASGQVSDGLTRRRRAEHQVFTGGAPLPPATDLSNVGLPPTANGTTPTTGAEGATGTGVSGVTSDFAAAGNMADLWSIAEQSGNFWDNELDTFDNYTYNLEFFIVDEVTTTKFLNEEYSLDSIMTDAWPPAGTKRVAIAMTGASTEFNIQDLTVRSNGVGSGNNARMAGQATYLSFNIVQVGNTSLNDSLQNAALLCGYSSIHDATWYIKIKFIGYADDQPAQVSATKVLPIKISKFKDLQTTTDARGTSTFLEGTILEMSAFNVDNNIIENTFTFDIKPTLKETIESYIEALNKRIADEDFSVEGTTSSTGEVTGDLNSKFINTYSVTFSPRFEELYAASEMNGPEANLSAASMQVAQRQNGVNIAQQVGHVPTGQNVYDNLQDICIQATLIADALRADNETFADLFVIKPIVVPKPGGLNIITNSRGNDIIYHFDIARSVIVKNAADMVTLVSKTAQMVDEIMTRGRCRKIYYYQYTGLNDQILDLQVSLNKQLTKSYVTPTNNFAWANFVNASGTSLDTILASNTRAAQALEANQALTSQLTGERDTAITTLQSLREEEGRIINELRDTLIADFRNSGAPAPEAMADDILNNKNTIHDALAAINEAGLETGRVVTDTRRERINDLFDRIEAQEGVRNNADARLREQQSGADEIVQEAIGGALSTQAAEALGAQSNSLFTANDVNNDGLILIEELDTDFVTRLTTEQFDALLQSLMDNPIVYRNVIVPGLTRNQTPGIWRTTAREEVELARSKYYEGLEADMSMQQLTMTIKGDPFWLNNYITPTKANELFGTSATLEQYRNYTIDLNGQNFCMIVTNKAAGTDENDNIKIANLFISIYMVKQITSSFSGGLFTQTLEMTKMHFPSNFKPLNPDILDATFEETTTDDGNFGQRPGLNDNADGDGSGSSNITAPVGAGTAIEPGPGEGGTGTGNGELQPGDGPGSSTEGSLTVVDPEAAYGPANAALQNALGVAFSTADGQNGFPTEAGAVQLAYAMNQMKGLCNSGVTAACTSVSLAEQAIIRGYQIDADETPAEYVQALNEAIIDDPDFGITPEGIALLNDALAGQGRQTLDGETIINVEQEDIDSFREAIEQDMSRYVVGVDDIVRDNASPLIPLDPGGPAGAFAQQNAEALLAEDSLPFVSESSILNSTATATGVGTRTINTTIPANTLTAPEMERAVAIQNELRAMINEKPLTSMTDTEYARAKALESALEGIVDNATTGTRGEIRDELIQRENRSELAQLENDLSVAQAKAEGFHWTTGGALEDAEQRDLLKQQVLEAQVGVQPDVLTEVKKVVNPDTGSVELLPTYEPSSIDKRPIIVPKTDPLPIPAIDNGDGTMTIEGPPTPRSVITDAGLGAVDATSLTEEQKQQYYDAIASNNGIIVNQFVESLSSEQQDEILALENTQGFIRIPGSEPAPITRNTNVSEQSAKELDAAYGIYDNIISQIKILPRYEETYTIGGQTWTESLPDFSQMKDIKYMDSTGNIQTFTVEELIPPGQEGFTAELSISIKSKIADRFETISGGQTVSDGNPTEAGKPMQTEVGGGLFSIIPNNNTTEEESQ